MHRILQLLENLDDEERDTRKYIQQYSSVCLLDKDLAELYLTLARAELDHYSKLHAQLERIIKLKHAEQPDFMDGMYQWVHDRGIARMAELKQCIDSCK